MNRSSQFLDAIKEASRNTDSPIINDASLARRLEITPSMVSLIRSGKQEFGPSLILRTHDLTGWSIRDIKGALGLRCMDSLAV